MAALEKRVHFAETLTTVHVETEWAEELHLSRFVDLRTYTLALRFKDRITHAADNIGLIYEKIVKDRLLKCSVIVQALWQGTKIRRPCKGLLGRRNCYFMSVFEKERRGLLS